MILRFVMLLLCAGFAALSVDFVTTPKWDGPRSDHFDGQRFFDPGFTRPSFTDVIRWQFDRADNDWVDRTLPGATTVPPPREHEAIRITHINHATLLVQMAGVNVLTDPVWSGAAGPFGRLGPRRYVPPGVRLADLPKIDAVIVSHNHYDHLDLQTLKVLAGDPATRFIVPVGNGATLRGAGIDNVTEVDWWGSAVANGLTVTAVPARHWSQRRAFDRNRALWAGFYLAAGERRVFFAGDTGVGPHFEQIRRRLGPPSVALLPIGAYLPRWFMHAQHIAPDEAVAVHHELGATHSVAMHFGTFRLADDGQDQPLEDLAVALRADAAHFWAPGNGEQKLFHPGGR